MLGSRLSEESTVAVKVKVSYTGCMRWCHLSHEVASDYSFVSTRTVMVVNCNWFAAMWAVIIALLLCHFLNYYTKLMLDTRKLWSTTDVIHLLPKKDPLGYCQNPFSTIRKVARLHLKQVKLAKILTKSLVICEIKQSKNDQLEVEVALGLLIIVAWSTTILIT